MNPEFLALWSTRDRLASPESYQARWADLGETVWSDFCQLMDHYLDGLDQQEDLLPDLIPAIQFLNMDIRAWMDLNAAFESLEAHLTEGFIPSDWGMLPHSEESYGERHNFSGASQLRSSSPVQPAVENVTHLGNSQRLSEKVHPSLNSPPSPPFLSPRQGDILGDSNPKSPPEYVLGHASRRGNLGGECNGFATFQAASHTAPSPPQSQDGGSEVSLDATENLNLAQLQPSPSSKMKGLKDLAQTLRSSSNPQAIMAELDHEKRFPGIDSEAESQRTPSTSEWQNTTGLDDPPPYHSQADHSQAALSSLQRQESIASSPQPHHGEKYEAKYPWNTHGNVAQRQYPPTDHSDQTQSQGKASNDTDSDPKVDLDQILAAIAQEVQQEYVRFYGAG